MSSDRRAGVRSRFGPSHRILELAQHKTSRTVWATTPRDPQWSVSSSALGAVPSVRVQSLSKHKRDFSARDDCGTRRSRRPSSKTFHYENIVRLSTPKSRSSSFQETGRPHVHPRMKTSRISARLLQLSCPKVTPQLVHSEDSETFTSTVSSSSRGTRVSGRLVQLSLPRLKQSGVCSELGRPEESIWTVSKAARGASASARVEMLATPKQLCEDYVAPREPDWSQNQDQST